MPLTSCNQNFVLASWVFPVACAASGPREGGTGLPHRHRPRTGACVCAWRSSPDVPSARWPALISVTVTAQGACALACLTTLFTCPHIEVKCCQPRAECEHYDVVTAARSTAFTPHIDKSASPDRTGPDGSCRSVAVFAYQRHPDRRVGQQRWAVNGQINHPLKLVIV